MYQFWSELKEFYIFGGMFSEITIFFEVMLFCQIYSRNNLTQVGPWWKDGQRYCYDNIFADLWLQGGDHTKVKGPLKFFDLFTWKGWVNAMLLGLSREFVEGLVVNLVLVSIGISMFTKMDP